jgi:molybdopterin converting factor subunit 1
MIVAVRLFARAKDVAGTDLVRLELVKGATVAQIRLQLALMVPPLARLLDQSAIAVNGEFADPSTLVTEKDEIALLPPVSGGTW